MPTLYNSENLFTAVLNSNYDYDWWQRLAHFALEDKFVQLLR